MTRAERTAGAAPGHVAWAALRRATLALALLLQAPVSSAADGGEAALVVAYLYNFALYTEWPGTPAAFEFCLIGKDELNDAPQTLERKEIAGRPIRVRHLTSQEVPTECNVLFIAGSEKSRLPKLLGQLAARPVLTVTDVGLEGESLAMVQLAHEQGRLSFSANLTAARAAGLNFSAKMLRIARNVR